MLLLAKRMRDTSSLKWFKDALKGNDKVKVSLFVFGVFLISLIFYLMIFTGYTTLDDEIVGILAAPTQTVPILNSTFGTNLTTENITVYNQSTADGDGNLIKNIYSWDKTESSKQRTENSGSPQIIINLFRRRLHRFNTRLRGHKFKTRMTQMGTNENGILLKTDLV